MSTNEYTRNVKNNLILPFKRKIWQKSYYDHIIRNQEDYNEIWKYIEQNPKKWMSIHKTGCEKYNPCNSCQKQMQTAKSVKET